MSELIVTIKLWGSVHEDITEAWNNVIGLVKSTQGCIPLKENNIK